MNMIKAALLLPIVVQGFKYDELKKGHCPHRAGDIPTMDFDPNVLKGVWLNVYDRKHLNEDISCYSIRFNGFRADFDSSESEVADAESDYFTYTQLSSDFPTRESELDKEMLTVRQGAQLNFKITPHGSIGFFEHSAINPTGKADAQNVYASPRDFSDYLWDAQYERYMQVIDAGRENQYVAIYQCLETAEYFDKDGKKLNNQQAFARSDRTDLDFTKRPLVTYEPKEDSEMTVVPMHFQNIKILWKPDVKNLDHLENEEINFPKYGENAPTQENLDEIKTKISKILPKDFSSDVFEEQYARLDHNGENCHYNPMKLEFIHHEVENYGLRDYSKHVDGFYSKNLVQPKTDL